MSIQKHSFTCIFHFFFEISREKVYTSDHTSQNISCYEIQLDHLKSSDRRKMIIDRTFNELTDRENAIDALKKRTHVYSPCIFLGGPGDNRRPRCLSIRVFRRFVRTTCPSYALCFLLWRTLRIYA